MKAMKKLSLTFAALALLLWSAMCVTVAYSYAVLDCCARHAGASAPASLAFLYLIPYGISVALFVFLSLFFYGRSKKSK